MGWPPRQGHSSSSRRAQNRALIGHVLTGLAIAAGLVLLLFGRAYPEQTARFRGLALDAVAPIWAVARTPFDAVVTVTDHVGAYFGAVSRNRALEAEHRRLRAIEQRYTALQQDNLRLKRLLNVVEPERRNVVVTRIAGASAGSYARSAIVSAGARDGVAIGQPVRTADGLVGRVVEVGHQAARVLLLNDANSRVPVRVLRTGRPAMAAGANGTLLEVRFVAPADGQLRIGDRLVTSGDGGIFPPDIPVAIVVRVDDDLPLARPFAGINALSFVVIEEPFLPPSALTSPASGTTAAPAAIEAP